MANCFSALRIDSFALWDIFALTSMRPSIKLLWKFQWRIYAQIPFAAFYCQSQKATMLSNNIRSWTVTSMYVCIKFQIVWIWSFWLLCATSDTSTLHRFSASRFAPFHSVLIQRYQYVVHAWPDIGAYKRCFISLLLCCACQFCQSMCA